jgi:hypothetical protein
MRADTPVSRFLASTNISFAVAPRDGVALSRTSCTSLDENALVAERLWLGHLRVSRPGVHE